MSQNDLSTYMEQLASELPLPLMLYNMPSCTKTAFDIETVRELSHHENIIGMKDTSGDLDYYARLALIAKHDASFSVLIGPEELLERSIALGGHGGVTGGANMFPALYVALYEAAASGDVALAQTLQQVVQRISDSMYKVSDSGARVIQGIKAGLAELGICGAVMAPPFRTYDTDECGRIADAIAQVRPVVESHCPTREVAE
jgi:4-hydroxy-tetrahydrodipicolinate synthase